MSDKNKNLNAQITCDLHIDLSFIECECFLMTDQNHEEYSTEPF